MEPQECRRFYIYRDVWLLSLPAAALLPLRYPADLGAVPSVPPHNRRAGPLWERPGGPKHTAVLCEWPYVSPCRSDSRGQQGGRLRGGGPELEINPLYIYLCNCN